MRLEFRPQADADIDGIIDYYRAVAPDALPNIAADIERSLGLIREFPSIYPQQPGRTFRRHVSSKYHFKIVYEVERDRVVVLGIFRYQNRDT